MIKKRRKVLEVVEIISKERRSLKTKSWKLKLECGHAVLRVDRGSGTPKSVHCDECEKILDRLSYVRNEAGGWVFARNVGATLENMKFLENEGFVECNKAFRSGINWRTKSS